MRTELATRQEMGGARAELGGGRREMNPLYPLRLAALENPSLFSSVGGALSFARASSQVYEDADGSLHSAGVNFPAFVGARTVGGGQLSLYSETGDLLHPVAYFDFKGQLAIPRLANFEQWGASTAFASGRHVAPGDGYYYESSGGTTGGSEPAWAESVVDNDITWARKGLYQDKIGMLVEPAATNKCTCYSFPPADAEQAALTSGQNAVGKVYEVKAHSVLDFTTIGAADNNVGTRFVATGQVTLTPADSLAEIKWAVGTYATAAMPANIQGFTCSGDAAGKLEIVDASAECIAKYSQLPGWAGKSWRGDNSAGSTVFQISTTGATGNTNPHTLSVCASSVLGTATLKTGGVTYATITNITIERVSGTNTPGGAAATLEILMQAGDTVPFAIPQLEESTYATFLILTYGASNVRASQTVDPSAFQILNDLVLEIDWFPGVAGQTVDIFGSDTLKINATPTEIVATAVIGSVTKAASIAVAHAADVVYRISLRKSSADGLDIFVNGVKGAGDATATGDIDTPSDYFVDGGFCVDKNVFVFITTETDARLQEITDYDD